MKKRLVVILATIISLTVAVEAATFDVQKSYDWLLKQQSNGSYGGVTETSASILALRAASYNPSNAVEYLASQEDEKNCWPKAGCKTKETAFVLLAYKTMGVGIGDITEWMEEAQSTALQTGNWWLEIATSDAGTCTLKYTKSGQEIVKIIKVENGRFPECGNTTFFNINNCIEANFLKNFPKTMLYVDCGALSNALISLIYNSANSYYLLTESQSKVAELEIENGCFGTGYKSTTCNYESTLYANWALEAAGISPSSEIYLRDNHDKTSTLHNSLLYIILKDETYLKELKARQRNDGSWDGDAYRTSLAVLALKGNSDYSTQFNNGVSWLKTKQREDGSFGDVTTTALVLYAAFTEGGIEFPSCTNGKQDIGERGIDCGGACEQYDDCCNNDVKDAGEEGIDCGGVCRECTEEVCIEDGRCDMDIGEDCNNCPADCSSCEDLCSNGIRDVESGEEGIDCGGLCDKRCEREVCDNNNVCDINLVSEMGRFENENAENCPNDCYCGDAICDDFESYATCPQDCPETGGCGDGVCDYDETEESCPEDCAEECNNDSICDEGENCSCSDCEDDDKCKEESKFPWMWVLILLILLMVVAAYLLYKKKQTKKKPEFFGFGKPLLRKPEIKGFKPLGPIKQIKEDKKPVTMMPPKAKAEPSRIEQELDRSIKEAKKLIGKK